MPHGGARSTVQRMIGYLSGTAKVLPNALMVVANGVGYRVNTPSIVTDGSHVEMYVTTVVREDAFTLYGFVSIADQQVFDALCAVSGVGPTSALALIRDVGIAEIARAVSVKDHRPLTKAKGVGTKAAERIVALVKLPIIEFDATPELAGDADAISALEVLGFDRGQARIAVATARQHGAVDVPVIITDALGVLRAG